MYRDMNNLIKKAKEKCEKEYNDSRPWKTIRAKVESWRDGSQDIELITRLGSPCKCYIIVNYGTGNIRAFNVYDKPIGKWNYLEQF